MTKEIDSLIDTIAAGRLDYGTKARVSQSGQIMDDARMIVWIHALNRFPEDEGEMKRVMENPELTEYCFDELVKIYRES